MASLILRGGAQNFQAARARKQLFPQSNKLENVGQHLFVLRLLQILQRTICFALDVYKTKMRVPAHDWWDQTYCCVSATPPVYTMPWIKTTGSACHIAAAEVHALLENHTEL